MKAYCVSVVVGYRESANVFLKELLRKKVVDALLAPAESETGKSVTWTLVTEPGEVDKLNVFAPIIPGYSGATLVSEITREIPLSKRVGVVLKPCEIKALIELVKFGQVNMDNLVLIGTDCYGTYHVLKYGEMVEEGKNPTEEMLRHYFSGVEDENFRVHCKLCDNPVHEAADITMGFIGNSEPEKLFLIPNTSKGQGILGELNFIEDNVQGREMKIKEIEKRRRGNREKFISSSEREIGDIKKLSGILENCINCHNCMEVCPICFCKECFFDSDRYNYVMERYMKWDADKGAYPLPTGKLQFHIGRMIHMATSCIGCGLCEQSCPMDVELSKILVPLAIEAQRVYSYKPGMKIDEKPPLMVIDESELEKFIEEG